MNFNDYVNRKKTEYGDKFSLVNINQNFIKYYENRKRILVKFTYWNNVCEYKTGIIGVTTGWSPIFLLMSKSNSMSSGDTIGSNASIEAVKIGNTYYKNNKPIKLKDYINRSEV